MKKRFTFLMAAVMLLTMFASTGEMWAEEVTRTENFSSSAATNNQYNCSSSISTAANQTDWNYAWTPSGSGTVFNSGIKLGNSGGTGSVTNTTMLSGISTGTSITIKVYAAQWNTDGGSIIVTYNGSSETKAPSNLAITSTSNIYSASDFTTSTNFTIPKAADVTSFTIASSAKRILIDKVEVVYSTGDPTPDISVSPATINAPYTGHYEDGYHDDALTLTTNVSGSNPNVYSVVYSATENGTYSEDIPEMMGQTGAYVVNHNDTFKVAWNVEENETQNSRECYFKIKYGTDTYSNVVHVSQAAAPAPSYSITLTGGNAITADYAGNVTSSDITVSTNLTPNLGYAIYYKDGDTYVSTNPYDWFEADVNSSNKIECVIDPNSTGANRTAQFKLYTTDATNDAWSEVVTLTQGHVAAPTFDPNSATFHGTQSVALASETAGASIRYTLDGTTPSATIGTAYTNGTPFSLTATATVKAIAYVTVNSVAITSAVSEATFTQEQVATPTFTPNGGPVTSGTTVAINCETTGAAIQYSTDGENYSAYSSPIEITANTTLYAKATADGYAVSGVAEATYTIVVASTYNKVTSNEQLVAGKHYIVVGFTDESSNNCYAMTYQDNNNRRTVKVTENNGSITLDAETTVHEVIISGPEIIGDDSYYTIYDEIDGSQGFIYNNSTATDASGTTKSLRTDTSIDNDGRSQWTIEIGDGGAATITTKADLKYKVLRFNQNKSGSGSSATYSPLFNCYASGQLNVYLYIKDGDNDCHIYSTTDISSNMTVTGDMNIHEAGWVTVKNGATLTVEGTITNIVAANLVIEDGGQLIHTSAVNATLQKEVSAYSDATGAGNTDGWYFIASPLDGFATSNLALSTADLYSFDEEAGMWWNAKNEETDGHPFTTLNINQGYLYANSAVQTLEFAGNMQATNKEVTIKLNKKAADGRAGQGVNLVGNPFTRSLNYGEVTICGSDLTSYYIVEGGTEIEPVTFNASTPIKPGRGFMVEASADQEELVLNPSAKGRATVEPAYISIEAGNESFMDRAYVQIGEGNTLRKMTINNNVSHVYVQQAEGNYAAATIETAEGVIPVAFDAAADGTYTITVNVKGLETEYLHLIDNMTGADVDLLVNPSYTFNARNNDYESRFKLVFSSSNTDEAKAQSDFAFISNGNLIVAGTGTLQIVDMMGRTIASYNTSDLISTSDLAQGVYVLRLVNGDNVKTQKIVVK